MSLKIFKQLLSLIVLTFVLAQSGCGVYTFTGVNISAETLTISDFFNDADNGPPNLAQSFTNSITDYYQSNTNLTLVKEGGELLIEGAVTGYRLTPVAPSASADNLGALSELTRLTITVSVSYTNATDDEFDFSNKSFSFFADFDSTQSISAVEAQLIDQIYEQIILDIFNATVANW